jgi:hypothetical protein
MKKTMSMRQNAKKSQLQKADTLGLLKRTLEIKLKLSVFGDMFGKTAK